MDASIQRQEARRMSPHPDVLRILIVDDHALFRRGLRDVLEEEQDLEVVAEAANGVEALRRVRELRPGRLDLVLMDLDMPTMGGIAATRQIVAEDPSLAVVMVTGGRLGTRRPEPVQAGATSAVCNRRTDAGTPRCACSNPRDWPSAAAVDL